MTKKEMVTVNEREEVENCGDEWSVNGGNGERILSITYYYGFSWATRMLVGLKCDLIWKCKVSREIKCYGFHAHISANIEDTSYKEEQSVRNAKWLLLFSRVHP